MNFAPSGVVINEEIKEKKVSKSKPMVVAPQGGKAAFPSAQSYGKDRFLGKQRKPLPVQQSTPSSAQSSSSVSDNTSVPGPSPAMTSGPAKGSDFIPQEHVDPSEILKTTNNKGEDVHLYPEAGVVIPPEAKLDASALDDLNQVEQGQEAVIACVKFLRSVVSQHRRLALSHLLRVFRRELTVPSSSNAAVTAGQQATLRRYYTDFEDHLLTSEESGQNLFLIVRCLSDSTSVVSGLALEVIELLVRQAAGLEATKGKEVTAASSQFASFVTLESMQGSVLLSFVGNAASSILETRNGGSGGAEEGDDDMLIGGPTTSTRPFSDISATMNSNFPAALVDVGFLQELLRPSLFETQWPLVSQYLAHLSSQRHCCKKLGGSIHLLRKMQEVLMAFPMVPVSVASLSELGGLLFTLHNVALQCGKRKLLMMHEWLQASLLMVLRVLLDAIQKRPDDSEELVAWRKLATSCIFSFLRTCCLNKISMFGSLAEVIPLGAKCGSSALLEAAIVAQDEVISQSAELQSYLVQDVPGLATSPDLMTQSTALLVLTTWLHHYQYEAFSFGGANVQDTLKLIKELLVSTSLQPDVLERSFNPLFTTSAIKKKTNNDAVLTDTILRYCKIQFASACALTWPGVTENVVELFGTCLGKLEDLEKRSNDSPTTDNSIVLISRKSATVAQKEAAVVKTSSSSPLTAPSLTGYDASCVELFSLLEMLDLFRGLGKRDKSNMNRRHVKFGAFVALELVLHLKVGSDSLGQCLVPLMVPEDRFPLLARFFVAKMEPGAEGLTMPWQYAPIVMTTAVGFGAVDDEGDTQNQQQGGSTESLETVAELSLEWANWMWTLIGLQIVRPVSPLHMLAPVNGAGPANSGKAAINMDAATEPPTICNPLHLLQITAVAFLRSAAAVGAFETGGADHDAEDSHAKTFPRLVSMAGEWLHITSGEVAQKQQGALVDLHQLTLAQRKQRRRNYLRQVDFHWQLLTAEFENSLSAQDPVMVQCFHAMLEPSVVDKKTLLAVVSLCCQSPTFLRDSTSGEGVQRRAGADAKTSAVALLEQFSVEDILTLLETVIEAQARSRIHGNEEGGDLTKNFLFSFVLRIRKAVFTPLQQGSTAPILDQDGQPAYYFSEFERSLVDDFDIGMLQME